MLEEDDVLCRLEADLRADGAPDTVMIAFEDMLTFDRGLQEADEVPLGAEGRGFCDDDDEDNNLGDACDDDVVREGGDGKEGGLRDEDLTGQEVGRMIYL